MKYRLNDKWTREFEHEEEAVDFLEDYLGITFDSLSELTPEQIEHQAELKTVLLETYCTPVEEEE